MALRLSNADTVNNARYACGRVSMDGKLFLRISEVADRLGVSRTTVYDLIQRRSIPAVRLAGRGGRGILRVPAVALEELAANAMSAAVPGPDGEQ
jgi:excisionase family DNA binding protein